MTSILDQPLRTRERAAVEVARKYLRAIAQAEGGSNEMTFRAIAASALSRIAEILGERS